MSDDKLALVLGELAALMAVESERLEEVEPAYALERTGQVLDSLMQYVGIALEDAGYDPVKVVRTAVTRMRDADKGPKPAGGLH